MGSETSGGLTIRAAEHRELVAPDGSRVSRRLFHDHEIYEAERQQIFQRCWLFVAHESQIPDAGDFVASYMGEEPVLVSRGRDGSVSVVVNSCSHRGTRLCQLDEGNASTLTCPYHGWQFAVDGRLLGVPSLSSYGEGFDKASRGLHPARVETYAGLIFATFDHGGVSLRDYLGDEFIYYLDAIFDRDGTGTTVLGGIHRWRIGGNWKLPSENQAGDLYHPDTSHAAVLELSGEATAALEPAAQVTSTTGHAMVVRTLPADSDLPARFPGGGSTAPDWFASIQPQVEAHLGPTRSRLNIVAGNVFPNFSLLPRVFSIRVNHPRGPQATEVWSYCLLPADAPDEVRSAIHGQYQLVFGPGGLVEEEDGENWNSMTSGAASARTDDRPLYVDMGLGTEYRTDELPGTLGPLMSEHNQRGFYRTWRRWMSEA